MTRLRLTVTFVQEYDADPENYDDNTTPEEMAEVDRIAATEDPSLFLDFLGGENSFSAKCEVVKA